MTLPCQFIISKYLLNQNIIIANPKHNNNNPKQNIIAQKHNNYYSKIQQLKMKLTNIGKYIKKNELRWLLFLLVPIVIGLIIHFVIPLLFVLNANPRVQLAYNNKKIQVQQSSIRSLSLLNSELIRLRLQVYQNIRNVLIRMFGQVNPYQEIDGNNITLNNAYFYANNYESSNLTTNKSMWYAQGISQVSQLDPVQQLVFSQYLGVEPFILSQFLNLNQNQQILLGLSLTVDYLGSSIYFQYPSTFKQQFLSLNSSNFDTYFNQSITNYKLSNGNFQYSVFTQFNSTSNLSYLVSCNVILVDDSPSGTSCLYLNLSLISLQLTQSLGIPNISYSQTSYYLLTPIYPTYQKIQTQPYSPRIILNFTDKNIQNIQIPQNNYFILPSSISQNLYYPLLNTANYAIFISEQTPTLIYFQVPIQIYDYTETPNIIMYLLVQYNFQKATFNSQQKYSQILKQLAIPSTIIIVVSTIASLIVIKCLLNCMDEQLFKINQKCQYIIHGDLDVFIPEYKQTQELQEVYKQIKIINLLNKFSTPQYFMGDDANKVVKFHKVSQLFKDLNYPSDTALQNIGQCYFNLWQYQKGIQYLNKSYQMLVNQIQQNFGYSLQQIFQIKKSKNQKLSKQYKKLQLKLTGRLWKLIHCIFRYLIPIPIKFTTQNSSQIKQIISKQNKIAKKKIKYQKLLNKVIQVFRKAAYPNFINTEGLGTFLLQASFQLSKGNYKNVSNCLRRFQRMMNQYQKEYEKLEQNVKHDGNLKKLSLLRHNLGQYSRTNPLISWSYFYYILAKVQMTLPQNQRKYSIIIQNLAKCLSLNIFMCDIMCLAHAEMLQLFNIFQLDIRILQSLTYFKQLFPLYTLSQKKGFPDFDSHLFKPVGFIQEGIQKQILFLFDCSNKWISDIQSFRKWQKETREISLKIFNLLKEKDRISISKTNSNIYLQTCCNLIYKNHNQILLTKQLTNSVKLKFMSGKCLILKALQICINRIKNLNQQKYFIIFLKQGKDKKISNNSLKQSSPLILKKQRKNTQIIQTMHKISFKSNQEPNQFIEEQLEENNQNFIQYYKNIREDLLKILLEKDIKNLKLILICQNAEIFKVRFNLQKINTIIDDYCRQNNYISNNLLYVLDITLIQDLQRIFGIKKQIKSERNNVNAF